MALAIQKEKQLWIQTRRLVMTNVLLPESSKTKNKVKGNGQGYQRESYYRGRDRREILAGKVNAKINPAYMRLDRIHPYLETFSLSELKDKNIQLHRLVQIGMGQAIGLDYFLQAEWTSNTRICSIRFNTNFDIFYKLPSDIIPYWKSFVNSTIANFLFLIVDEKLTKFALFEGRDFEWILSNRKKDKNRLYAIRKDGRSLSPRGEQIQLQSITGEKRFLFDSPSLIQAIREVFL